MGHGTNSSFGYASFRDIYIYILEMAVQRKLFLEVVCLPGASYDVLCCIITQEEGVARNRCCKVLLGIEWDAGAAILAPPEFTTSSFLHSKNCKAYPKHHQKPLWKELFDASGRICGGTLFLANH